MALLLPKLESLTGLLNSIAGATLQITAVPLALCTSSNPKVVEMMQSISRRGLVAMAVYGAAFTLVVFMAAIHNIAATVYTPDPALNETFWCNVVGADG